jgi:riboflavin kinase/FMN adenylyltransferase
VGSDFALGYRREGHVKRSAEIGRDLGHHVSGIAKRGGPRDRELRFTAARVTVPDGFAVPASGVYAARVRSGDRRWSATVNVEPNSTGTERGQEVLVPDFPDDLYEQWLRVEFVRQLQPSVPAPGGVPLRMERIWNVQRFSTH